MSARGQKPKPAAAVESTAHTIPLSDVTITMDRRGNFGSGKDHQAITVTGRQLGQVLAWLAETRPGCIGLDPSGEGLWSPTDVALSLEGLGGLLRGLGEADFSEIPLDPPSLFCFLAEITRDLAARLSASDDGDDALQHATFTLPTRTEADA